MITMVYSLTKWWPRKGRSRHLSLHVLNGRRGMLRIPESSSVRFSKVEFIEKSRLYAVVFVMAKSKCNHHGDECFRGLAFGVHGIR